MKWTLGSRGAWLVELDAHVAIVRGALRWCNSCLQISPDTAAIRRTVNLMAAADKSARRSWQKALEGTTPPPAALQQPANQAPLGQRLNTRALSPASSRIFESSPLISLSSVCCGVQPGDGESFPGRRGRMYEDQTAMHGGNRVPSTVVRHKRSYAVGSGRCVWRRAFSGHYSRRFEAYGGAPSSNWWILRSHCS